MFDEEVSLIHQRFQRLFFLLASVVNHAANIDELGTARNFRLKLIARFLAQSGQGWPETAGNSAFRVGEQGFVVFGRDAALSRSVPGRVHRFDCHSEPAGIKCAHEVV